MGKSDPAKKQKMGVMPSATPATPPAVGQVPKAPVAKAAPTTAPKSKKVAEKELADATAELVPKGLLAFPSTDLEERSPAPISKKAPPEESA